AASASAGPWTAAEFPKARGSQTPLRAAAPASIPRRPLSGEPRSRLGRWALSSAVEHYLDMVGVRGSIPLAPTISGPSDCLIFALVLGMRRVDAPRPLATPT